jgi:lipoate-protein ligase A
VADWTLVHPVGSPADVHQRDLPDPMTRQVWWCPIERPTLVLGSTQDRSVVDEAAVAAAGVDVAVRRSGGGAVLLDEAVARWVDVLVPRADPLWDDDVSRSAHWLGQAWVEALGQVELDARVHAGPMVRTRWSSLVCFAGLAPGEVTTDGGAKLVGISQRRTRAGARFQCVLLRRWDPGPVVDLLALAPDERATARAELAEVGAGVAAEPAQVAAAFAAALATR